MSLLPGDATSMPDGFQESHVVAEEVADVRDAVLEHRDALGTHAEGEAAHPGRIVPARPQHPGMDHAGAQDLEPAALLAQHAAGAAAEDAADVHLDAGLGEREVALAEAQLPARSEHLLGEGDEDPLEVAEGDALADRDALDLVEHPLRAGGHLLVAIGLAR